MIQWVVLIAGAIHSAVFCYLLLRFQGLKKPNPSNTQHTFSIIVPVRNEESTILTLVQQILAQDYPKERFEVIVVDDSSEDATLEKLKGHSAMESIKILELSDGVVGKKKALELGIQHAKHDWILTTDGDCEVTKNWVNSFNAQVNEEAQLIVGPVRMEATNWLGRIQSFDFSLLIGYAASLVSMGVPSMSNGANLCYRKSTFKELGGYTGNDQIPSGDDEFILLKVVKNYPNSIRFNNDSGAVVSTMAKPNFGSLLNQRKRWLSKWTLHKNPRIVTSVLVTLLDNLLMILGWVGIAMGYFPLWLIGVFVVRGLVKGFFSYQVNKLLKGKTFWFFVGLYELLYPFYVVLLSFASIFGYYTWKGRKYT
jgi:cellulose synthase/poly-beta-1,6-N-acetylglucosamine synthase-like glycosyltransferase